MSALAVLALSAPDVGEVVVGIVVSVCALVAAAAKFKSLRPIAWLLERLVMQPLDEVLERRIDHRVVPTVAEAVNTSMQGLTEQVERLGLVVHGIHYEMHPNSGASMRDVLDRVEGTMIYTQGEVTSMREDVSDLKDRTARLEGSVEILRDRA